jgi:poly(3-hydroxybutyrate) depolymerase
MHHPSITIAALLPLAAWATASSCSASRRASSGCGSSLPSGFERGALSTTQTTAGNRAYKVFVPTSYAKDTATPLILSYHGANGKMDSQAALDRLTDPFFGGATHIVVYLQGNADDASDPNHTTWQGAPGNESDDLGFTADVLDELEQKLCVDTSRVYATGKSQGGGFVNRLACDPTLSTRIAAFAPVSGAYYIDGVSKAECGSPPVDDIDLDAVCSPGRKGVPILAFHGGNDKIIDITGDWRSQKCLPDVRSWIEQWADRNGLDVDDAKTDSIEGSDNGKVTAWGGGVVTFVYDGDDIGHDWPATIWNNDNSSDDDEGKVRAPFNATSLILDFFDGVVLKD